MAITTDGKELHMQNLMLFDVLVKKKNAIQYSFKDLTYTPYFYYNYELKITP